MAPRSKKAIQARARDYDARAILEEIEHEPIEIALDQTLREQILAGKRTRQRSSVSVRPARASGQRPRS